MTKESHNVEFKQSWQDDYLKWICGFANAQGGHLYIGKNDTGMSVRLPNAKIHESFPKAGLPSPVIVERTGGIAVELYKSLAEKDPGELGNQLGNQLGNTKERIIAEMKTNPKVSATQLAEKLSMSITAVEKNIQWLRENGLIKRIGRTRGHWEVKE